MTKFELEDRYLALRVLDSWTHMLFKNTMRLNDNNTYRFGLKCKTRGLVSHDRVLMGRIV